MTLPAFTETQDLPKWFPLCAGAVIVSAIAAIGWHVGDQAGKGVAAWWVYPAFFFLVVFIFWMDWKLSRKPPAGCHA